MVSLPLQHALFSTSLTPSPRSNVMENDVNLGSIILIAPYRFSSTRTRFKKGNETGDISTRAPERYTILNKVSFDPEIRQKTSGKPCFNLILTPHGDPPPN